MAASDNMVERVARALAVVAYQRAAKADARYIRSEWATEETYAAERWPFYCDEARAAIEAMREPTERMKQVFCSARPESPRTVWHEVIDAALSNEVDDGTG